MAGEPFHVEVVSPERPLLAGDAEGLVVEAHDGEMGIRPGHASMVSLLGTGIVRVAGMGDKGGRFAIRGGFLQVCGSKVSLLVTEAVRENEVDPEKARAELERVKGDLRHPPSDEAFARLLDERRWYESQIRIAGAR